MKKYFINITLFGLLAVLLLSGTSCKKDYTNPAAVPEDQAFSSPQAMTGVAIGLQRIYTAGRASNLYNRVTINGLLTSELTVLNQGNTGEYQLQLGRRFCRWYQYISSEACGPAAIRSFMMPIM